MSSSREILAKTEPQISLASHLTEVGRKTREVLDTPGTERLLRSTSIGTEEFLELAKRTGCYHDVGKAHPEWQDECWASIELDRFPNFPPHSSRSSMYAFENLIEQGFDTENVLSVTTAILHHHTPFTLSRMNPETVFDTQGCGKMVSNIRSITGEMPSFSDYFSSEVEVDQDTQKRLKKSLNGIRGGRDSEFYDTFDVIYERVAILSSLLHSALVQADHYVSAVESGGRNYIPSRIREDSVNLYPNLRPFQKGIDDTSSEHLLGLAGCGEGKTHSAFQWGIEMVEKGEADRLVFAMPTQVTTNNLLLSIRENIVNKDDSTLYHGSSEDFLEQNSSGEEDWQSKELDGESRRWFKSPVTVCTVDHVLSSLVNGYKTANVAKGNLLRSAVVFDEIHAYDGYTTGHILSALQKLNEMGIPWYVMTATMPQQLREKSAFDNSEIVESEGRLEEGEAERNPFEISLSEEELTAEEVLEQVDGTESKKVMVVKNTVKSANRMAQLLDSLLDQTEEEYEIVYYSSEFIQKHRKEKEEEIRDKFGVDTNPNTRRFLISTQVCEISLDLSADLLLTDIAPMDALVQRAGRLHREGRSPDCGSCICEQCDSYSTHRYECVVYSELCDEETDRLYPYAESDDSEEWKILTQTHEVLRKADTYSFENSLRWMDEAYQDVDFHRMEMRTDKFARIMDDDMMYGKDRNLVEDNEDSDLTIRRINNRRISVLPCVYKRQREDEDGYVSETAHGRWAKFHDCERDVCGTLTEGYDECVEDLRKFLRRNTVPVPSWWLHTDKVSITHLKYEGRDIEEALVMDVEYYYGYGVIRPDTSRDNQPKDVRGSNRL